MHLTLAIVDAYNAKLTSKPCFGAIIAVAKPRFGAKIAVAKPRFGAVARFIDLTYNRICYICTIITFLPLYKTPLL